MNQTTLRPSAFAGKGAVLIAWATSESSTIPPFDIQRLSVDLMFQNFERNETHLWPREDDTRGARHQIQVIADDGSLLRTFDIRDITKESGLKFLGRKVDITG